MDIDGDGTLYKTNDAVLSYINFKHGTDFTAYDIVSHNFWEQDDFREAGVTADDFWDGYREIHRMGFTDALVPYDRHTLRVLRRLQSAFDVSILTAKEVKDLPATQRWLERNLIYNIPIEYPSFGDRVSPESKFYYKWDVLIDDNPNIALKALKGEVLGKRRLVVPSCPWNRDVSIPEDHKQVKRVDSWLDIERHFFGEGK